MKSSILSAALLLLISMPASSNALESVIAKELPADIPGAIVYVAKDGQPPFQRAYGMADLALEVPMQVDYKFPIGSVSKQFTAVAILQLQEAGKLEVGDNIDEYLPDYPLSQPITIAQLLNHTAGIPNFLSLPEWKDIWRNDVELSELQALFSHLPLEFPPGQGWRYSNSGYVLLAQIIEVVSGQSYHSYLQQHLLGQPGLQAIVPFSNDEIIPGLVRGYIPHGGGHRMADYISATHLTGSGSLVATAEALHEWHQLLEQGTILLPALLQTAWSPTILPSGRQTNYGFGWQSGSVQGVRSVEHGGYLHGFFTAALRLPSENLSVIIFINSRRYDPMNLAVQLAAAAIGKPYPEFVAMDAGQQESETWYGTYQDDKDVTRTIGSIDGELYIKRGTGSAFSLQASEDGYLHYEESLSYLSLEEDEEGSWLTLFNRQGEFSRSRRINREAPLFQRQPFTPAELKEYSAEFEFAPNFSLRLFTDDGRVYIQGTNQNAGEVMKIGTDHLIATDLIAEFLLQRDEDGNVYQLLLKQAGREMQAPRVK